MNRETPSGFLDQVEGEHRRKLWWTVYILDRKISMNMGSPSTIQDQDIDLALPDTVSWETSSLGLSLHVKLAALTGKVVEGKQVLPHVSGCH
jgi:proline utilization trans-activator